MADTPKKAASSSRATQVAMVLAAAAVSKSFERTLMPRSTQDQGIVTGMSMALVYTAGFVFQDQIEDTARFFMSRDSAREADDGALRRMTMLFDLGAIGAGLSTQAALRQTPNESLGRAAVRSSGWLLSVAGIAGFGVGFVQDVLHTLGRGSGPGRILQRLPAALIAGGVSAGLGEYMRRRRESIAEMYADESSFTPEETRVAASRSVGIGVGVMAVLSALSVVERLSASVIGEALSEGLPGNERLWQRAGHLGALGALGALAIAGLDRVYQSVEGGTIKIEAAFDRPPKKPHVSGSPASAVSWRTMGREGRRHISTVLDRQSIEDVMGEPAVADPVRVFVGLDSAPTELDRVNLAISELVRIGIGDRELLIAVSPTGTGYVNYVAIECAEYFTRGNCATVTLQYSKRPSPLSLDRVWEGRKQFRMLLAAIRRELYKRPPDQRPRLVVFGESLGAHTSQDAFLHQGTQGLEDAGVERALWIGSPRLSAWRKQVTNEDRPDVDKAAVIDVDNFGQIESLSQEERDQLRYVMVTHHNDGVGLFGPDLAFQRPEWLGEAETRTSAVPRSMKWTPLVTAVQTAMDMNNAMSVVPGEFVARGHDYRADLARFVREVYALSCSDEQLERVEDALRRDEILRQERMEQAAKEAP